MFLKTWKVAVTDGGNPQGRDLFLVMRVELQCPVCEEVMAFETQKRALEAGAEFLRDWATHDVLEPKMCPTCGAYSGLPERYKQQLRLAANQEITQEWLDEERKKHNLELFP